MSGASPVFLHAPATCTCQVVLRSRPRPLQGLSWVLAAQRWQSPLLTTLFTHSSHSVSVSFYVSACFTCARVCLFIREGPLAGCARCEMHAPAAGCF